MIMKIRQLITDTKEDKEQQKPVVKLSAGKNLRVQALLLFYTLLVIWVVGPHVLQYYNPTASSIDQSIWLLIVLAMICFMLLLSLCWWIFKNVWKVVGLPGLHMMVSQFNLLSPWQQLSFFWASFALVLLAALGSLSAVL
jgi:hypothetical protein